MVNDVDGRLESVVNATCVFMEVFGAWMQEVIEALRPVVAGFWEVAWERYGEAGMPYGECDEGLARWLKEGLEVERLRWEADLIEERQRGLTVFRARLREGKEVGSRE